MIRSLELIELWLMQSNRDRRQPVTNWQAWRRWATAVRLIERKEERN